VWTAREKNLFFRPLTPHPARALRTHHSCGSSAGGRHVPLCRQGPTRLMASLSSPGSTFQAQLDRLPVSFPPRRSYSPQQPKREFPLSHGHGTRWPYQNLSRRSASRFILCLLAGRPHCSVLSLLSWRLGQESASAWLGLSFHFLVRGDFSTIDLLF